MCDGESLLLGHTNDQGIGRLRSHARTRSSPEDLSDFQGANLSDEGTGDSPELPRSAHAYHQKHAFLESIGTHTTNPRDAYSGSASDEFTCSDGENEDGGAGVGEEFHDPFSGDDDDTNDLGIYASPPRSPRAARSSLSATSRSPPWSSTRCFSPTGAASLSVCMKPWGTSTSPARSGNPTRS